MGSREAAFTKVASAQHDLEEKRRECAAVLEQERVCGAQARKIAATLKHQKNLERDLALADLEVKLEFKNVQADEKIIDAAAEGQLARMRNAAWQDRTQAAVNRARIRADGEEIRAVERANVVKVALSNLQAQHAAYIRNLEDQWACAKTVDAAQVEAAGKRTEDLMAHCDRTMEECEKYCIDVLARTEHHAETKTAVLEERVSAISDLASQRVNMVARQSRERREQAEQQLADLQRRVDDVRRRCEERVCVEAATADEKTRLVRERLAGEAAIAYKRTAEAEERRDKARDAFCFVMARCRGFAAEAKRRGHVRLAEFVMNPQSADSVSDRDSLVTSILPQSSKVSSSPQTFRSPFSQRSSSQSGGSSGCGKGTAAVESCANLRSVCI